MYTSRLHEEWIGDKSWFHFLWLMSILRLHQCFCVPGCIKRNSRLKDVPYTWEKRVKKVWREKMAVLCFNRTQLNFNGIQFFGYWPNGFSMVNHEKQPKRVSSDQRLRVFLLMHKSSVWNCALKKQPIYKEGRV